MNQITTFFCEMPQAQNYFFTLHNYSNLIQSQILFYMPQQLMVPDHGTKYKENRASHHERLHEDGYPDGRTARRIDG